MTEHPSIPTATYRLQIQPAFKFLEARDLIEYLHELGISHIYSSPFFLASPGSTHGYDVCDHSQLNPALGSRQDFDAYVAEIHRCGMGQLLDFVPNHMGIGEPQNNRWWTDVLENGPSSPYARYFDIDWQPLKSELENKVLLPVLGDQYGRVLERGELRLHFEDGAFHLEYYSLRLPVAPRTSRPVLAKAMQIMETRGQEPPAELASILTALEYLPNRTETDPERVAERMREKEIIRGRLARLCAEETSVAEAIRLAVDDIQTGGETRDFSALDEIISSQPYRLSYWRCSAEEINYRRFFDIDNLAAIRMELHEVFEAAHQLVFELIGSGAVTGLRIDHVDGLYDPRGYLEELQKRSAKIFNLPDSERGLYLVVEKILAPEEHLHSDWPVHGTTGYEFGNQATNVLLDSSSERLLTEAYEKFTGLRQSFADVAYRGKLLVMRMAMAGEVNLLGHMLNRLSESNRWYRDFTVNALTTAVRELIACFPVYRTYIDPAGGVEEQDARVIHRALNSARRRNPAFERSVFEFLRDLLLPPDENHHPVDEDQRRQFVLKLQQCTGPITAKGVEDTAFYVYNRLIALNEVGGEPGIFGATVAKFHEQNAARLAGFPHSLLATSTHDTKRSEDVRARIAAISEIPRDWVQGIRRWRTLNLKHKAEVGGEAAPDANEEYFFYQTLAGAWPLDAMNEEAYSAYVLRVQDYMEKAIREGKVNSSWIAPNEPWETGARNFVAAALERAPSNRFLSVFEPLARRIAELGMVNSLAQTVLKLTVPGVPDIYQGNEIWDFSLVDPDNRRPVDYSLRRQLLASLQQNPSPEDLMANWRDGRIKLHITHKLLCARRQVRELFDSGAYEPVAVAGQFSECCIAFRREHNGRSLLVVVPRLSSRVGFPPLGDLWQDTRVECSAKGVNLFTGESQSSDSQTLLSMLLSKFPVAVVLDA